MREYFLRYCKQNSVIHLVSGVRYHPPCHVHCQPTFRTLSPPSWTPQGFQFWGKIYFYWHTQEFHTWFPGAERGVLLSFLKRFCKRFWLQQAALVVLVYWVLSNLLGAFWAFPMHSGLYSYQLKGKENFFTSCSTFL